MEKAKYYPSGSLVMVSYYDVTDLAYDELCQLISHFIMSSSDAFHEGDNARASYQLGVAERYRQELNDRVILTAI